MTLRYGRFLHNVHNIRKPPYSRVTTAPLLEGLDSWKSQESDRIEPGVFEAAGFEEDVTRLESDEEAGDYDMGEEDLQDTRMSRYLSISWLSYSRLLIVLR